MEELHNRSCEPMDIDLSANSVSEMDISYNNSGVETPVILIPPISVKKEKDVRTRKLTKTRVPSGGLELLNDNSYENTHHIVVQDHTNKTVDENNSTVIAQHIVVQNHTKGTDNVGLFDLFKLLFAGFIVFISIAVYQIQNIKCKEEIDLELLQNTLSRELYGQNKAIESIVDALKAKDKNKILFIYGGTGVGKTYTSSLIMENFGVSSNIYHYTMPSFTSTIDTDVNLGFAICKSSVFIVDDLTESDIQIKSHINDLVTKSENLGKAITIILIYNCDSSADNFAKNCDESFHRNLLKNYLDVRAYKKFVRFEPLTEVHLRKCIEKELGDHKISETDFEKIEKNFNVTLDGCKGVHTKMRFLNATI